jgi:hypothetical protein
MTEDERTCRIAHMVDSIIPNLNNVELAGRTCNCGKLEFYSEMCSCPNNPQLKLKSRPNPSYNFQQ